jgi:hypothetical protein
MHRAADLRAKLLEIAPLPSSRRWALFEALLYTLFKRGHFRVERDSRAAGLRQLDLVASEQGISYFVEAKWKKRPVGVGDLDGLYARLDGTPGTTVGVLISPSGFTGGVSTEVIRRKGRPVLLLGPSELGQVVDDPWSLRRMLKRKLDHFVVVGEVLVGPNDVPLDQQRSFAWSEEPARIVRPDGRSLPWITCGGDYGSFVFTQELTDVDWTTRRGRGASVDFRPEVFSLDELSAMIDELQERGWLSTGATWIIEQAETTWHGFGCSSLLEALRGWRERYAGLSQVHHTEVFCVTDSFDGRLIVLNGDVTAHQGRNFSSLNLSLHLSGIPADAEPLIRLAEVVHDDEPIEYRGLSGRAVETVNLRAEHMQLADPVAFIVEARDDDEPYRYWVKGIAVANPHLGLERSEIDDEDALWWPIIRESELVICALSSWHPLGERPESYELRFIEWTTTSDYTVMRYVADWRGELRGSPLRSMS